MKKIILFFVITVSIIQLSSAQIKDVKLDDERLEALLNSAKCIDSIPNISNKQIDSVISLFPELNVLSVTDLKTIYSFMVPNMIPNIAKNKAAFVKCGPYAKKYIDKLEAALPSITEKYPKTTEQILANNLNVYFQLYLYLGLTKKNKLGILDEIPISELSSEGLDKILKEALVLGSAADEMIYFTMAHSFKNLFDLIILEYKIPTYKYSIN